MKNCLVCYASEPSDAETCSRCGNASWSHAEPAAAVPTEEAPASASGAPPHRSEADANAGDEAAAPAESEAAPAPPEHKPGKKSRR